MSLYCKDDRVGIANRVLGFFAKGTSLRIECGYILVSWSTFKGRVERRWMTRGQDFYPVWHRKWTGGGTASTALSQLVRWVQGKPVLPLSTWSYWTSDKYKLLDPQAIEILRDAGYPEKVQCVRCGSNNFAGGMDWWGLDGVSGPSCRQCEPNAKREEIPR